MGTNEEAIAEFKKAFLSITSAETEEELGGTEKAGLQDLARQVLRASKLVAEQVLPGILAPLENEFRQLNRQLLVDETVNIEPFRDKAWRNDLAQEIVGDVNLDFLSTIPGGTFRESILNNDPNSSRWGREFVDYVATTQKGLVEALGRLKAERLFMRPLRDKVHVSRVEASRGKVERILEIEQEFREIQDEVTRIRGANPTPPGLAFMKKIAHTKSVNEQILTAVGAQIKAALNLSDDATTRELKQFETVLAGQAQELEQFKQLGGGESPEQLIEGCALRESRIAEEQEQLSEQQRAHYDALVEAEWKKLHAQANVVPETPKAFERSQPVDPDEDPMNRGFGEGRDLLPYVVVSGTDRGGRTKNLHAMFNEPVVEETLARARATVTQALGKTVNVQPTSLDAAQVEGKALTDVDIANLKTDDTERAKWNAAIDAKLSNLDKARMGGSSTMKDTNVNVVQAKVNWLKADELVCAAATSPDFDPLPENLMKLMFDVNATLGDNVFEEEQTPGEMRSEGNAGAGTHKAPMDIHGSDHWAFEYVNGDEVEREMLNLLRWVSARIKAQDNPIETAGHRHP